MDLESKIRREKHVLRLQEMRRIMIESENWEYMKGLIEAVTAGGMALQRLNEIDFKESSPAAGTSKMIPVSEKLPEENGNYLIQVESSDGTATISYFEVDHYNKDGTWLHYPKKNKKIVAWMELPEKI